MAFRENFAQATLLNSLPREVNPTPEGTGVRVEYAGAETTLTPVWVAEGFPADVRRGLEQARVAAPGTTAVIVGKRISTGSQDILDDAGVSWVDADGHANIRAAGIFVSRLPQVTRPGPARGLLWSGATSTVAEVILERHGNLAGDNQVDRARLVSDLAEISYARASRILSNFDDNGYTSKVGPERGPTAKRVVRDAGGLLSDWASHHARTLPMGPISQFHVPWRSAEQSLSAVSYALGDMKWLVSGLAGAQMLSPFLTDTSDVMIYVSQDSIEDARRALISVDGFTAVDRGGRVHLHPGEPHLEALARDVGKYRTAPAVRIYGDLMRLRGRAIEAAESLREAVIGF